MNKPTPHHSIRPLTVGERGRILPDDQEGNDTNLEFLVIEVSEGSSRVKICALRSSTEPKISKIIEAEQLERVIDTSPFAEQSPEIIIAEEIENLPRSTRLWLVEKFPNEIMATEKVTNEEAELCAQLHPVIAIRRASHRLSDASMRMLAETHPYDVLLHASERIDPQQLRHLAALHPGTCMVILEKYPESRLRYSLRAIIGTGINPNVADAVAIAFSDS